MMLRVKLQHEAVPVLREMAKEAGVGVADLAEIAVYNLIALWQKERGVGVLAVNGVDGGGF